ncbi:MAG: VWA domain-containing protein, partial [Proteobacteria bacterium]
MKETFEQLGKKGLIDILVVIDDSGSMTEEQKNLSTKMNSLLTSLKDTNWQIGIVTTTVQASDKCILTLVKSTDTDAEAKFAKAVQAGLSGSGNEEGIRQAVNGLKCSQSPWVRADSSVAVLIVSDEDNCSSRGADCPNSPGKTISYLTNYIEQTLAREIGKTAGIYGIFSPTVNSCKTAGNIGYQYEELMTYAAQKSGTTVSKIFGNICDADYSNTLNAISSNIALLLKNQFELSSAPDSGSLKLSVEGSVIPAANYKFSGKTITFNAGKEPANGKVLTAEYNVGAVPLFTKVTLKNTPAADTISVKVGSTVLAASAYTVSGNEITFKTQPASLAKIAVDYRVAAALKNAFQLEKTPIAGSLKVLVDGKAASGMTYDAAANQVVLNPAPLDGLAIELNYNYRTGPQLSYQVAIVQGAKNVKLYDGAKELSYT